MLPVWQSWMPQQSAYVRMLSAAELPSEYPQNPEVHGLPPDAVVYVLHEASGLPIRLFGALGIALTEAGEHGYVVARIELKESPPWRSRLSATIAGSTAFEV